MEQNILYLSLITLVCYFVVGNPYTYAIMSKLTKLSVKDKKQHMILVGIHAAVMTLLMYGAYLFLIKDKECPPNKCPPNKCPEVKQPPVLPQVQPPVQPQVQPPVQQQSVQQQSVQQQSVQPSNSETLPKSDTTKPPVKTQQSGLGAIEGFSF